MDPQISLLANMNILKILIRWYKGRFGEKSNLELLNSMLAIYLYKSVLCFGLTRINALPNSGAL